MIVWAQVWVIMRAWVWAIMGGTGLCDRARVVVARATVLGHWMAVIQVTVWCVLVVVTDL